MKKNFFNFLFCFALFLILAALISCGGGGGGAGSLFMPENELRNGGTGGWGGKGKSSSFGAPASNLVLTGGTSLDVEYYVYNGQRYNTAEELLAVLTAIQTDGTIPVEVHVRGETSARPGRYVKNGNSRTLQHPYKINIALPEGGSLYPPATSGTATEYFYASEGFPVSKLGSDPVTENCGVSTPVDFPLAGWNIGGQTVASNGKITGFSGDMNLIAAKVPEKYTVDNDVLAFSSACQNGESFTIPSSVSFSTIVISSRLDNEPIKLNLADSGYHNDTYANEFKNVMDQNSVNRISSIILPNNITKINSGGAFGAFESSTTLTSVTIPASVEIIGDSSFCECSSLTTVTFSGNSNLRTIAEDAFNGCSNLAQITIPSGVTTIGDNAFSDCSSLVQITIPKTVATTGEGVFINCTSLRTVTFESDSELEYINDDMFLLCSQLQAIDIPSGVESIGTNAFSGCSALQTVTIPDGVINIMQSAFANCSSLRGVTIPSSVTAIGASAFEGITFDSNNEIRFEGDPLDITYGSNPFNIGAMATYFDGNPGSYPFSYDWTGSSWY